MKGTTRHICRDQDDQLLRGDRKGPPKGHIAGCRGGVWTYAVRCPTKQDPYAYLRRARFTSKSAADAELNRVISLLSLAPRGSARWQEIGQAIWDGTTHGRPLDEDRIRHKVGADRDPSLPTPTLGQWAEDWIAANGALRSGTRAVYVRWVTHYIGPWLGTIPLDALRPVHVTEMLDGIARRSAGEPLDDDPPDQRQRRSLAGPAVRSKVLDFLRTLMKAAVDENVITRNPIARYRPKEEYHPRERGAWSSAQVEVFLQHAQDDRLHALFRVALLYGLRRGELLGLRWEDVDLDAGILHVRQQVGWIGSRPTVSPPKTRKSRRSFSIGKNTVAALRRHRREQMEEQLRAGSAWQGTGWGLVFCREDGSPLRPYDPLFALQRLTAEVGLPQLNLHEMRHTAVTNALAAGVSPKIVSERAGHATVNMTFNVYGHVLLEHDREAADTIEGTVG
jgi:integrase